MNKYKRSISLAIIGAIATILALSSSFIQFYFLLTYDKTQSYEIQIKSLDSIQNSLQSLSTFVKEQKDTLEQKEKLLAQMEEERKHIEPILKADREQVTSILEAYASQQRRNVWIERAIGFFSGIASSFFVASAFTIYQSKRKARSVA